MKPLTTETAYCGQCGAPIAADAPDIERFGERFCSTEHAGTFVDAVRASRVTHAARESAPAACGFTSGGDGSSWKNRLKRSACWVAPLLILVAIPLLWSGSALAATGGSILSVLALLACPLGMFFMMRAMMPGQQRDARGDHSTAPEARAKEERHA